MADKRITDVDYVSSLNSDESFFINQNNAIKQINKSNVVFGIANGGTGATNAADALSNLGITATATELNYCDGLTGNIQAQLNSNQSNLDNKMSISPYSIELNKNGESSIHGGYIDFHFGGSSEDYTSRIIEDSKGVVLLNNKEIRTGTVEVNNGGTGATDGATGLKNLFAAGYTVVSPYQYGDTLPDAGMQGRIFYKKVSG